MSAGFNQDAQTKTMTLLSDSSALTVSSDDPNGEVATRLIQDLCAEPSLDRLFQRRAYYWHCLKVVLSDRFRQQFGDVFGPRPA